MSKVSFKPREFVPVENQANSSIFAHANDVAPRIKRTGNRWGGLALAAVVIVSQPAFAGDMQLKISCARTSQIQFDAAAKMVANDPLAARHMFQQLVRYDRSCAILYWELAMLARDRDQLLDDVLDAIIVALNEGVNDAEWERISRLTDLLESQE